MAFNVPLGRYDPEMTLCNDSIGDWQGVEGGISSSSGSMLVGGGIVDVSKSDIMGTLTYTCFIGYRTCAAILLVVGTPPSQGGRKGSGCRSTEVHKLDITLQVIMWQLNRLLFHWHVSSHRFAKMAQVWFSSCRPPFGPQFDH